MSLFLYFFPSLSNAPVGAYGQQHVVRSVVPGGKADQFHHHMTLERLPCWHGQASHFRIDLRMINTARQRALGALNHGKSVTCHLKSNSFSPRWKTIGKSTFVWNHHSRTHETFDQRNAAGVA
jgi:hypothetical protein